MMMVERRENGGEAHERGVMVGVRAAIAASIRERASRGIAVIAETDERRSSHWIHWLFF